MRYGLRTTDPAWQPVSNAGLVLGVAGGVTLLAMSSLGDRWVPVVDHANLAVHEAGHALVGLVSARLAVYGGTLAQLAFPVLAAVAFWRRRESLACALALFWLCQNLSNVATYMGDARALQLPLVGALDPQTAHDWREILTRWQLITWDTRLAALLQWVAWCGALGTGAWLASRRQVHRS